MTFVFRLFGPAYRHARPARGAVASVNDDVRLRPAKPRFRIEAHVVFGGDPVDFGEGDELPIRDEFVAHAAA